MKSKKGTKKELSRRDFIKTTAVGVGATALAGIGASKAEAQESAAAIPVTGIPTTWDYEADVVIVGLGAAGASAAIEAHDQGAKVLVLEKQPYGEGEWAGYAHFSNSRMSGGVRHSPHPDGDREAMVRYCRHLFSGELLPWKHEGEQPHVSEELARMYVSEIYKLNDWLMSIDPDLDRQAMEPYGEAAFPMFPDFKEAKYGATRNTRYKDAAKGLPDQLARQPKTHKQSGEALHWALVEVGMKNRNIEVLYGTPGKRLVQRENGEIIGVIAEREEWPIACKAKKAVILTTGGIEYSEIMRRAFLKGCGVKGWAFYGTPDNRGDGIAMALRVGAALAKPGKCASRPEPGAPWGRAWIETGMKQGLSQTISFPGSILVDNYGHRFIDEWLAVDGSRAWRYQSYNVLVEYDLIPMNYSRQPSWQIFDETFRLRRRVVGGRCVSTDNPRLAIPWAVDNSDAIARGWILKGETIEELAAKIKADPENRHLMDAQILANTVKVWNGYCAGGKDLEFGRAPDRMGPIEKPPFYALHIYAGGSNTKGSVDCDATRHVLDWEYKPIPRLYSAGEMSSLWKFVYQAGGNITECMVCGRVAGRYAAAEVPWDGE